MAVIGSLVSAIAALLLALPGTDPRAVPDMPGSDSLRTRHFVFQYAPQQEKVAQRLSRRAEAIRARHCKLIEPCFDGAITVQIAQTEDGFLDLQPYRAHIDWAAGVAYAELQLIILRVDKDMLLSLDETFEHEVSHVLLLQATKERPPRWFIEGMAIIQADQDLIERFERVSAATLSDSTLRLDEIAESFPASTEGSPRPALPQGLPGGLRRAAGRRGEGLDPLPGVPRLAARAHRRLAPVDPHGRPLAGGGGRAPAADAPQTGDHGGG
jgi:hypothetical protein